MVKQAVHFGWKGLKCCDHSSVDGKNAEFRGRFLGSEKWGGGAMLESLITRRRISDNSRCVT
jgi:hypothetical protein